MTPTYQKVVPKIIIAFMVVLIITTFYGYNIGEMSMGYVIGFNLFGFGVSILIITYLRKQLKDAEKRRDSGE